MTNTSPQQEVPLISALNRAEDEMEKLCNSLSDLLVRLEMISRPECSQTPDNRKDPRPCPVLSSVTSRIHAISEMAENMCNEINKRRELLEL